MKLVIGLFLILGPLAAGAEELGTHEEAALQKTQDLLRDKAARDEFIRGDKKAADVDQKVDHLTGGGANKDEIYDIAAQVMERLSVEAKGDPEKMQQILMEAHQNPKAFYDKMFDAEQKARVRGLANKIEKKPTTAKPPR